MPLIIPENYQPILSVKETEIAIKKLKDYFENKLAEYLNLTRVSAPLFVDKDSGLNDNLSGVERPVSFDIKAIEGITLEIVQSLAKWKRLALHKYNFYEGEGLYTDMNAIRRDDELDNLHSLYVDQWDWEIIINKKQRNLKKMKEIVESIFCVFKETEEYVNKLYSEIRPFLPDNVYFISSQELEDRYPDLNPEEREQAICKEKKAVFITQIGGKLRSGNRHNGRAPDYDDWELNGDLLFWYPLLNKAVEVSSMGIRVDEDSLVKQLKESNHEERLELPFHQKILRKELPYTIGGGIGQSRICMLLLQKAHIGEVQVGIWPESMYEKCKEANIFLL
ncbi:MAG: aspartate--ammonia ligase [Halanaerobiaceae bacterium]|nr:aspartate--ammonia ligase [Halanaerobiaceae bacterium]